MSYKLTTTQTISNCSYFFIQLSWRFELNSGSFDSWKVLSSFRSLVLYPLWYIYICHSAPEWLYLKFGFFFFLSIVYWVQMKCTAVFQYLTSFGIWILDGKSYIYFYFLWMVKKPCMCVLSNLQSTLKLQCNSFKMLQSASHGNEW